MPLLDVRQRTGWLFTAVVLAQLVLISAQVTTRTGVPMLEVAVFGAVAELQRLATGLITGTSDRWQQYVSLQDVRLDNERLRTEMGELQIQLQQERALAQEARTLQALLDLKRSTKLETISAAVIAGAASPDFRTLTIDKGTRQGVQADMAVVAPAGVVGRVITPSARAAKVQLLIDRNAAVAGLVERTRAQGVVVGTGGDRLEMEYVPGTADIKAGDRVVTSGIDGIYPKGFLIGQIESVQRGAGDYTSVVVKPAVELSALEAVLVVSSAPESGALDDLNGGSQPR
jgi:rod shape-determining protein MreC